MNDIPDSLISKWVKPFREIGYDGNKMISYQHEGEKYNAVLIGIIDETNINKKDQDHYYVVLTQYLLTVKDDGSLIEGLKVQEFIPGGDLLEGNLDSARYEKLILNKNIYGRFKRDTIKIFDRTLYLKETGTNNEELKQEEYEGIDETTYVISANGKIKKVGDKKGELKKLSEDTGERMKLK